MYQEAPRVEGDKAYCVHCGELIAILRVGNQDEYNWERVSSKNYD